MHKEPVFTLGCFSWHLLPDQETKVSSLDILKSIPHWSRFGFRGFITGQFPNNTEYFKAKAIRFTIILWRGRGALRGCIIFPSLI
jgi:hypothetical protein